MTGRIIFGRYELLESLSRIDTTSVYVATDLQLRKKVVVKLVRDGCKNIESNKVKRFMSEIALLQTLNHPGIIKVFDNGQDDGDLFYVMEHIPGNPLSEDAELSLELLVDIFLDIAEILRYLHSKGIIHRDVKPSNIMVLPKPDENGKIAKIIDYGLAKFSEDERITSSGVVVGTLNFMAPELMYRYGIDTRSDLYSLGASMFYMLTGRFPFEITDPKELALSITDSRIPDFSKSKISIPKPLSDIIIRLLKKDIEERPGKIEEVIDVLQQVKAKIAVRVSQTNISVSEPELIGRSWEIRNIIKIWDESVGSEIIQVKAPFGFGKSRLLEEISLRLILDNYFLIKARGLANSVSFNGSGLIQLAFELSQYDSDFLKFQSYKNILSLADENRKVELIEELSFAVENFSNKLKDKMTIVIDDFHLFDRASASSILQMVHKLDNVFLLISVDIPSDGVVNGALDSEIKSFELDPLEGLTYIKFIQASLGQKNLPADLYSDLIKNCRGNPYYTLELLRLMVTKKCVHLENGRVSYKEATDFKDYIDYSMIAATSLMGLSGYARVILEFLAISHLALKKSSIEKGLSLSDSNVSSGLDELKRRRLISETKKGSTEKYVFNIEFLRPVILSRIDPESKKSMELELANLILESKIINSKSIFDIGLHLIKANQQYRSVAYFLHYIWEFSLWKNESQERLNDKLNEIKSHAEFRVWQILQDISDSMYLFKNGKIDEAGKITSRFDTKDNITSIVAEIIKAIFRIYSKEYDEAKKIVDLLIDKIPQIEIHELKTQICFLMVIICRERFDILALMEAITKAYHHSIEAGGYNTTGIAKIMISNLIDLFKLDKAKLSLASVEKMLAEYSISSEKGWIKRTKSIFFYVAGKLSESLASLKELDFEIKAYKSKSLLTKALLVRSLYYLGKWDELLQTRDEAIRTFGVRKRTASNAMLDYFSNLVSISRGNLIEPKIEAVRLMNDLAGNNYLPIKITSNLIESSSEFYSGNEKIAYSKMKSSFTLSLETKQPGLVIDTAYHILTIPRLEIGSLNIDEMNTALEALSESVFPLLYEYRLELCLSILKVKQKRFRLKEIVSSINFYLDQLKDRLVRENLIYTANVFIHLSELYDLLAFNTGKTRHEEIEKMLFGAEFIWQVLDAKLEIGNIMQLRKLYLG